MKPSVQQHLYYAVLLLIVGTLWLSGCTAVKTTAAPPGIALPPLSRVTAKSSNNAFVAVQIGTASWYGPNFHGRKTASGELFNQEALTAAHPVLPLGTRVKVTRVDTNRSIEVEINDRGPFVEGRIIDLSLAAARALDTLKQGTTQVRLEVLFTPQDAPNLIRTN